MAGAEPLRKGRHQLTSSPVLAWEATKALADAGPLFTAHLGSWPREALPGSNKVEDFGFQFQAGISSVRRFLEGSPPRAAVVIIAQAAPDGSGLSGTRSQAGAGKRMVRINPAQKAAWALLRQLMDGRSGRHVLRRAATWRSLDDVRVQTGATAERQHMRGQTACNLFAIRTGSLGP